MKPLVWTLFVCSMASCVEEAVDRNGEDTDHRSETIATNEQAIIGGVTDTGDPCVVAVFAHPPGVNSGSLCTGTVVGAHTVLTAAHCVSSAIVGTGQIFEILPGTTLTLPGIVASSTTFDPLWNPSDLLGGHDIGVVHTAGPFPEPWCAIGPFNPSLAVRLVGYGSNTHNNTGAGTKRQVTTNIVAFNGISFQDGSSNQQTCSGDAGGPAFQGTALVGVASFGQDSSPLVCVNGGFHGRTDAFAAFINANMF